MKIFKKVIVLIALMALFASCQSSSDTKEILSKPETRKEVMDKIANDSSMSKEIIESMMNSQNGKIIMQGNEKLTMMMMENHSDMMKMMKDNPMMIQSMMADMMEAAKGDTNMMSKMCKTMMSNQPMMDMMQKIKGNNMEMGKMNAMDSTKAEDHKSHH